MTPNLLQIIESDRPEQVPLMMEFPVNPAMGPFLVSRSSSENLTLWVARCKSGKIRSAARETTLDALYDDIVRQVILRGREEGWENTAPLTEAGVEAALAYVESYGFEDIEVLAHPNTNWKAIHPAWEPEEGAMVIGLKGRKVQPAAWLDPTTIVVVPRDRAFVGFVLRFQAALVAVVHNAPRGMGIATSL